MDNILQYLKWRKDIPFSMQSFHDVDALIFSALSYVEWDGIVSENAISLSQACKKYLSRHSEKEMKKTYIYSVRIPDLVAALEDSKRYEDVHLTHYRSVFDVNDEIQFAAISIQLPHNHVFLSFRGTDSSMVGWKEDLKMTYSDVVPSQQLACSYLETVFGDHTTESVRFGFVKQKQYPKLFIGGHSKGGNLAMCAAICVKEMQQHIAKVYNFDGPGFRDVFYQQYDVTPIIDRITTYLPESSIIGRLLLHKEKSVIIKGYESGLAQHDCFNWMVDHKGFVEAEALSKESDDAKSFIEEKLLSQPEDKTQEFVEMLFRVLSDLDIKSVSDISELSMKQGLAGLKELSAMNNEERKLFLEILYFLWGQTKNILFAKK